ncbi:MAG: hypothetical protein LHW46_01805 [Candidatus Cloacimonetes bacterium]|nr:hypothetical protein [Candidatus Cloacimonadota bacterium]
MFDQILGIFDPQQATGQTRIEKVRLGRFHQPLILVFVPGLEYMDNVARLQVGFHQKGKWNYNTQVAEEILILLNARQFRSIREIASDYGKSRQLVFVYLEALASISIVASTAMGIM